MDMDIIGGDLPKHKAAKFDKGDIIQNCFSYHFTPAGLMFDEAARILKCTIFPAGGGILTCKQLCQILMQQDMLEFLIF